MNSVMIVWSILKNTLLITVFVFVMMLLIDYLNVLTNGRMSLYIKGGRWRQYLIASFLGSTPGCLGAFMNVSFYIHGLMSFGAIVGGMIATSGDEAFVLLTLVPDKALLLFGILFVLGFVLAWVSDKIADLLKIVPCRECELHEIHTVESCKCFDKDHLAIYYLRISWQRALLLIALIFIILSIILGIIGPQIWDWKRITFIILTTFTVIIVGSVPDHFLREHIWKHIIKKHMLRVFLWSFFALFIIRVGFKFWDVETFIKSHMVWVLLVAVLIGIIPESGPHMVFVMMFAEGLIPFSVLLASSIVQDGHGMLPLLSYSLRDTILVKIFNFVFGLTIGLVLYYTGI